MYPGPVLKTSHAQIMTVSLANLSADCALRAILTSPIKIIIVAAAVVIPMIASMKTASQSRKSDGKSDLRIPLLSISPAQIRHPRKQSPETRLSTNDRQCAQMRRTVPLSSHPSL